MPENLKSDEERINELYEDWYGPPRDKGRAFRTRMEAVEEWYFAQRKKEELEAAEVKGRRFLVERAVSLVRFVGIAGVLSAIGFAIRFYNSWKGGAP